MLVYKKQGKERLTFLHLYKTDVIGMVIICFKNVTQILQHHPLTSYF